MSLTLSQLEDKDLAGRPSSELMSAHKSTPLDDPLTSMLVGHSTVIRNGKCFRQCRICSSQFAS